MFFRRDLNLLIKQRTKLVWAGYDRHKIRIDYLNRTIRAMADNVIFRKKKKIQNPPENNTQSDNITEYKQRPSKKPGKPSKNVVALKKVTTIQKELF